MWQSGLLHAMMLGMLLRRNAIVTMNDADNYKHSRRVSAVDGNGADEELTERCRQIAQRRSLLVMLLCKTDQHASLTSRTAYIYLQR